MLSISSLIEFLLDLLRDEELQAEFERDPQGVLAEHGLHDVTAEDVRDVAPLLADQHGVSARPHGEHRRSDHDRGEHHDDDCVREIQHVRDCYECEHDAGPPPAPEHTFVEHPVVEHNVVEHNVVNNYTFNYYDNSVTAGENATVIQDSFNQDNDGVDNKGGTIEDSNVAGGNQDTVGNSQETTVVQDSFNEDDSTTIVDSLNEDNGETYTGSFNDAGATVNDSYNTEGPVLAVDVAPDAVLVDAGV